MGIRTLTVTFQYYSNREWSYRADIDGTRAMTATSEQLLEIERRPTKLMKGYTKLIGGVKAK
jgi:hypothetical protein